MSCFLGFRALSCELELSLGLKFFSSTLSLPSRSVGSQRLNARPFFSLPFMFLQVRFFILLRIHWKKIFKAFYKVAVIFLPVVLQLISISEQKFGFGSGGVSSFSVLPIRCRCEPMPHSLLVRGFKLCRDAVIVGAGTLSRTGKSQKKPWQGWKIQSCFELVQMSLTWKDALAYSVNCFCSNFINSTANLKCQLDVSRILYWKFTAYFYNSRL